jgi:N-acetylglucosaminyldiphosphoundecaprenol N-acetyl-beta-D-mannosaminyltransferase
MRREADITEMVSRAEFLGYRLVNCEMQTLVAEVISRLGHGEKGMTIACLNPHSFMTARVDTEFRAALMSSTYLIPDGIGVVAAARLLGLSISGRITGSDVFAELLRAIPPSQGAKLHFIGSTESTLAQIACTVGTAYPNVKIIGMVAPPFGPAFDESVSARLVDELRQSKPDILWVGMTAPKQEKWIARYVPFQDVGVAAGIGAVFDFVAGNKRRAPAIIQALGMEWLFRLALEPRRLWRRTVVSGVLFMLYVLRRKFAPHPRSI